MATPDLLRRPVRLAGDVHDPGHALDEEIVAGALRVGPGLAEAGDRAIDEPRVERAQALVVEAEFGEAADLEVLDQHVRTRRKAAHDLASRARSRSRRRSSACRDCSAWK